jgi:hypothetical protein
MEKIRIGGLKFSDEQVLVSLPEQLASVTELPAVLHGLVQHKVNLAFLCADYGAPARACFCLEPEDLAWCRVGIDEIFSPLGHQLEVTGGVGTLIIFPHQGRLALLGRLLAVFGRHRLPFYSLCSSLSGWRSIPILPCLTPLPRHFRKSLSCRTTMRRFGRNRNRARLTVR